MKQKKKQILAVAGGLIIIFLAVICVAAAVSHLSKSKVDTKEGLAVIKAAEAEDVKDIETKIQKLNEKDRADEDAANADGSRNFKSIFSSAVVMGDSITEALTEYNILNASSVVAKIGVELNDLDDEIETAAEINPQMIFLTYGTNDILATNGDTEEFIKEYKSVISKLQEKLPDTKLFVNSIFPVSQEKVAEEPLFAQIGEYNTALQEMCDANQLAYIDNTSLVSSQYYEDDGLHFKSEFYTIWLQHMAEVAEL